MHLISGTGTQRAAKTSRIQIAGQNLAYASWEATISAADLLTTNFESYNAPDDLTYTEGISGVTSCEAKFGGSYDFANGSRPFSTAPGLYPRDDLATVNFITTRVAGAGSGTQWNFPYMRIRGASNSSAVEGLVLFNVTDAKNQGRFTYPV